MAKNKNSTMGAFGGEDKSKLNTPDQDEGVTTDGQGDLALDLDEDGPPGDGVLSYCRRWRFRRRAGGVYGIPATPSRDTGMAFIFVQHLAAQHASMLVSLLSRSTAMPVKEVRHGTPVKPNHVYVIPPNALMRIAGGVLELEPRPEERGAPRPIDHFLHSLAADRKAGAIGVILSGADSDGALGLQTIREEGGIAIVQTESSAKHPDMPRAALAAGAVDLILSPEEMGEALERIGRHPSLTELKPPGVAAENHADESQLNRIFALIRTATGVDFRGYKRGTIQRRIHRRMILQRHKDLEAYRSDLESNRSELLALFEDILISVTGFFRDPRYLQALENEILPRLLHERKSDLPLRYGCPAVHQVRRLTRSRCAWSNRFQHLPLRSPSRSSAPTSANGALRPPGLLFTRRTRSPELSPERQARFFSRVENGYQIAKPIREMCVFARQNLLADPPFSRLDLISCRNVLIYLGPAFQRQAIATCHYASAT